MCWKFAVKFVWRNYKSYFLSTIGDGISDVSYMFQMAIVCRYMVQDRPVVRFWVFLTPSQHDAYTLAPCIIEKLEWHKINEPPQKLISQACDGASITAGNSRGVQAIVRKSYTDVLYVHCHAHQLNLVMMKAAFVNRDGRIFFLMYEGFVNFSNSPQRTAILE